MVGASLNSHHDLSNKTLKFLCSYGGRILPRYPDGKLRYHGGETRVISVQRSISFSELSVKLGELNGNPGSTLRCQLPTEDLDALVSITCDEDLVHIVEEYDRAPPSVKIRAFLSPKKTPSPPSSASSSSNETSSPKSPFGYPAVTGSLPPRYPTCKPNRHLSRPPLSTACTLKAAEKLPIHKYECRRGNGGHVYLIHNGNHWQ